MATAPIELVEADDLKPGQWANVLADLIEL